MQKLFSLRAQPIQLSSDDEDEFSGSSGGCMPCLPRFFSTQMNPIQLSVEDATLDDYLDPNTTTTIEPLLNEFNAGNQQNSDAFGGAVLHERSLTRNPFASAPTSDNTSSKRDFAVASQMDFFMETDIDAEDAEFLSDHRISAVIGDTSKLSRQFELFQVAQQNEDAAAGKDESVDDGDEVEPYELGGGDWSKKTDLKNKENELIDTADEPYDLENTVDTELNLNLPDIINTMDLNNNPDERALGETPTISTRNLDVNDNASIRNGLNNGTSTDGDSSENCAGRRVIVESNSSPISYDPLSKGGNTEESIVKVSTNQTPTLFAQSSPPSPIPATLPARSIPSTDRPPSFETSLSPIPAVSLPPSTPFTDLSDQVTPFEASISPPSATRNLRTYPEPLTSDTRDDTMNEAPLFSTGTSTKTSHQSTGPAMDKENDMHEKRRSSVATVAHSFLGDKLDDFTEKLAFIRKNIIMSLDDSNDDDDQEENMLNIRQQQQLRRSRSGSLQDWRQQSFDPFVSRFSGKSRQHRPVSSNDHDVQHRRSTSMMDNASSSFSKRAQPPNDESQRRSSEINTDTTQTRSYSSPILPPRSSVPHQQQPVISKSTGALGHRHNSMGSLQGVHEDEEEEDLFDFSKVIAMGKNVRNISEDLMGNGIRLFNDFSTRMKNNANHGHRPPNQQSSTDHEYFISDPVI